MSDQRLADRLRDAGYPIARRTVAKHRARLGTRRGAHALSRRAPAAAGMARFLQRPSRGRRDRPALEVPCTTPEFPATSRSLELAAELLDVINESRARGVRRTARRRDRPERRAPHSRRRRSGARRRRSPRPPSGRCRRSPSRSATTERPAAPVAAQTAARIFGVELRGDERRGPRLRDRAPVRPLRAGGGGAGGARVERRHEPSGGHQFAPEVRAIFGSHRTSADGCQMFGNGHGAAQSSGRPAVRELRPAYGQGEEGSTAGLRAARARTE